MTYMHVSRPGRREYLRLAGSVLLHVAALVGLFVGLPACIWVAYLVMNP